MKCQEWLPISAEGEDRALVGLIMSQRANGQELQAKARQGAEDWELEFSILN